MAILERLSILTNNNSLPTVFASQLTVVQQRYNNYVKLYNEAVVFRDLCRKQDSEEFDFLTNDDLNEMMALLYTV